MLLVYTGSNYQTSQALALKMIESLSARQPEATTVEVDTEADVGTQLRALANDRGMFFSKSLVKIPRLFPDTDTEANLKDLLPLLQSSESVFVWSEPDLNKTWIKRLEKLGAKVTISGESQKSDKDQRAFAVSNAFLTRDRRKIWQAIKQAQKDNLDVDQLLGVLWWQIKSIFIAKSSADPKSAGLNPFVYRQSAGCPWDTEALEYEAARLLLAQKNARETGGLDLWLELEAWALSIK